jgi:hypothetical protein
MTRNPPFTLISRFHFPLHIAFLCVMPRSNAGFSLSNNENCACVPTYPLCHWCHHPRKASIQQRIDCYWGGNHANCLRSWREGVQKGNWSGLLLAYRLAVSDLALVSRFTRKVLRGRVYLAVISTFCSISPGNWDSSALFSLLGCWIGLIFAIRRQRQPLR